MNLTTSKKIEILNIFKYFIKNIFKMTFLKNKNDIQYPFNIYYYT